MHKCLLVMEIILLGPAVYAQEGGEVEAVKRAVIGAQEAGWLRHDFKTYMAQWADDARIVIGRAEQPGKYETVFDRKQIEATRRMMMSGKAPTDRKINYEDVKVKLEKDQAELRVRNTGFFGEDYQTVAEIYRLRKTPAGWKVYLNRAWVLKSRWGNQVTTFDADTWKKLDAEADALVATDKRGDRAANALVAAYRFSEAHKLLKKVTAQKDATAGEWLQSGYIALTAGQAEEAMSAFRMALKLDPRAPVPEIVRETEKK
jgi:hypothetical protein